jgi:hypothetical protein
MADKKTFRVFISSPGDVSKERKLAMEVLKKLEFEPSFERRLDIAVIAWNQEGDSPPMYPDITPQEAIDQGLPSPRKWTLWWSFCGAGWERRWRLPMEKKKMAMFTGRARNGNMRMQ